MIKPKNKPELIKLLAEKSFKIILIEEGKATDLANQVRKLNGKMVTLIILDQFLPNSEATAVLPVIDLGFKKCPCQLE